MKRLELRSPIVECSAEWRAVEGTLQGNIAKPHGRQHSALLLFVMQRSGAERAKLRELVKEFVTSAQKQRCQSAAREADPNTLFGNLGLSSAGYRKLQFAEDELARCFSRLYDRDWFLDGMAGRAAELGDAEAEQEEFYRRGTVDGILLLACDDIVKLDGAVSSAVARLNEFCGPIHVERGSMIVENGVVREPFGFRDAIAMPSILDEQSAESLLFADRVAGTEGSYGTFLVYRKLEQDVAGFGDAVRGLANAVGVSQEYAEAMIMGRFKDGTPLSNSDKPTAGMETAQPDFLNDLNGNKCPFHAHVRKVNPQWTPARRRATLPLYRRSSPYEFEEKKGLLFLSMQENIAYQFGEMMRAWVNGPDFVKAGTGTDSLMGKPAGAQLWNGKVFDVGRHVTFRGGEFFFLPSLAFFGKL